MSFVETGRNFAEASDRAALTTQEDAVEVASQWAQEKLENFLLEVEKNGNDEKLLKISYIVSRRTSIDVFTGKSSDIGPFAKDLIVKLAEGSVKEALSNLTGTLLSKLLGAASGSAQTERIYEVTFDELGGLNRLDAFFFCYRFASSGMTDFSKAVIGTCIVRSAALMVDDNAYRVVLTSSATLEDKARSDISNHMIEVAKNQKRSFNQDGVLVDSDPILLEARAKLAQVIGEGVATSPHYLERKGKAAAPFNAANKIASAEAQADQLAERTSTNTYTNAEYKQRQLPAGTSAVSTVETEQNQG